MNEFLEGLLNYCTQNTFTEENCDPWNKFPAWNKGKKLTEEHKKALSESHKKIPKSGNARPEIIFSVEHKRKLSEARKRNGCNLTNEAKEKLRKKALEREKKPICDTCPHCNYHGLKRVVYKYHRQNCKTLPK